MVSYAMHPVRVSVTLTIKLPVYGKVAGRVRLTVVKLLLFELFGVKVAPGGLLVQSYL